MRVNIVTVQSGWILQKIAERLSLNFPKWHHVVLSPTPLPGFDVYYYNDIQNCYHDYKSIVPHATHVGYLTHAHENSATWLRDMFDNQDAWKLDGIKSMNMRYTKMLRQVGYEGMVLTTTPPADERHFVPRRTRLLIANRGGYEGYGHDFMMDLPDGDEEFLKDHFRFTFMGNGWEPVADKYIGHDIETVHVADDGLNYPLDYELFYHQTDYLLIPILWTAGPYCAMEAHLCGVPIIASDVGLINYEVVPDYCYPPGDKDKLMQILREVRKPMIDRRNYIKRLNDWGTYALNIAQFMEDVHNARQG